MSTATLDAAVVRRLYEARQGNDLEAAADLIAEDVVWHEPYEYLGTLNGRVAVMDAIRQSMVETEGTFKLVVTDLLASDLHVVALVDFSATALRSARSISIRSDPLLPQLAFPALTTTPKVLVDFNDALAHLALPLLTQTTSIAVNHNHKLPTCEVVALFAGITAPTKQQIDNDPTGTCARQRSGWRPGCSSGWAGSAAPGPGEPGGWSRSTAATATSTWTARSSGGRAPARSRPRTWSPAAGPGTGGRSAWPWTAPDR